MRMLVWLMLVVLAVPVRAASVRAMNLEELVARADRVFVGKVLAVRVAHDPVTGHVARFTTFDVVRAIKGHVGVTVTIKQLAGQVPGMSVLPMGMPSFQLGQELVLFLHGDSELGYTSPVGMAQGQLPVRTGPDGSKRVLGAFASGPILNGLRNSWVKTSMSRVEQLPRSSSTRGEQAVDYGTFISTLDRLVQGP